MSTDVINYIGNLGGRVSGPFGVIEEKLVLADFTDNTDATGTATLETALPEGTAIWSIGIDVEEGFTGTAAVTAAVELDAVAVGAGGLVVTVGGERVAAQGVDGSSLDPVLSTEDGEITVILTDTVDFGVIVTGATGIITVRLWYVQMVPSSTGR